MIELFIGLFKFSDFIFLLVKCTYNTHTGQVFPCNAKNLIQSRLYFFVKRSCGEHNAKNDDCQYRNRYHKNKRRFDVNRKCHNHCTEYNKR